jgi:5,10-methylenetetrahydromethanopterin reductase
LAALAEQDGAGVEEQERLRRVLRHEIERVKLQQGGIWFAGDLPVSAAVEVAEQADASGVDTGWVAEGHYARDAWTTLSSIAVRTNRVKLGTGVVPVFTRHPALLAMSFATLDELSGGRVIAGIGSGERNNMKDELNYDFRSPLSAMREAIAIMRAMFRGDVVNVEGRIFSARDIRLSVRVEREIPVYAAAVGPKMCELVGELGDGVYFPQTSPIFIEQASRRVAAGLELSGRTNDDMDYAAMVIASVHEDSQVARKIPRGLLATLLAAPEGEHILSHNGLVGDDAVVIREALATGGVREAVKHVTDDMVTKLTASGTEAEVTEQIQALLDAGLDHPVLSAIGPYAANVVPVAARFSSAQG